MGMSIYGKRILVVDRDAVAGLLLSYMLEEEGCQTCSVRDERAAWHEVNRKRVDAVVMKCCSDDAELAILTPCRSRTTWAPAWFTSVGPSGVQTWRPVARLRRPYNLDMLLRRLWGILHESAVQPSSPGGRWSG